jgi:hypothetical protein
MHSTLLVIPRKLPLASNPARQPRYFRHAMALDEHRAKFKACRFQKSAQEMVDAGLVDANKEDRIETDVLEVWFMGAHCDVGGGSEKNDKRHMLSRTPLRWMIRQTFECETNILFDTSALAEKGLDVQTLWPVYKKLSRPVVRPPPTLMDKYESETLGPIARRSSALESLRHDTESEKSIEKPTNGVVDWSRLEGWTPEQVEDYFDSRARINDILEKTKLWWILEIWPVKVRLQRKDNDEWIKKVRMNLGRYRGIPDEEPNLHWTVRQRMDDMGYQIKARIGRNAVWRTVV